LLFSQPFQTLLYSGKANQQFVYDDTNHVIRCVCNSLVLELENGRGPAVVCWEPVASRLHQKFHFDGMRFFSFANAQFFDSSSSSASSTKYLVVKPERNSNAANALNDDSDDVDLNTPISFNNIAMTPSSAALAVVSPFAALQENIQQEVKHVNSGGASGSSNKSRQDFEIQLSDSKNCTIYSPQLAKIGAQIAKDNTNASLNLLNSKHAYLKIHIHQIIDLVSMGMLLCLVWVFFTLTLIMFTILNFVPPKNDLHFYFYTDFNGLSDPYVRCTLGKESVKTSVFYKTLNAVVEEILILYVDPSSLSSSSFDATSQAHILHIDVFDYDMLSKDDSMGSAYVNVNNLFKNKSVKRQLRLDAPSGAISFTITACNFGKESEKVFKNQNQENQAQLLAEYYSTEFVNPCLDSKLVVLEKIKNSPYAEALSSDQMFDLAGVLSSVDRLKETYLSTTWAATMKLDEMVSKHASLNDQIDYFSDQQQAVNKGNDELEVATPLPDFAKMSLKDSKLKQKINIELVFVDMYKDKNFQRGT